MDRGQDYTADAAGPALRRDWWRDGPRLPAVALFGVVALALLATLFVVVSTVEAERTERNQAERTAQVIATLNTLVATSTEGETGQRGYFITSDKRYLEPFNEGRATYGFALTRLKGDLGTDLPPEQRELLQQISRYGDIKWREMGDVIAQVQRGEIVAAHQRILSDEGQLAMDALRSAVGRFESIEQARLGEARERSAAAEARLLPALGALFLVVVAALTLGLWQAGRTARAEAAAANARAISDARDRADLLARELNHRVKNLFAVIIAIVRMTGKGEPAAKPVVDRITARLHALVTAHEVSQGALERPVVDLAELVETALAPYRSDSERCEIEGATLMLAARMAVPLGLVLHELVTNAVKYGAWAQPGGLVRVAWRVVAGEVRISWTETCAVPLTAGDAPASKTGGFGSVLMQSSAGQLGGAIDRTFRPEGIQVDITFPAADAG